MKFSLLVALLLAGCTDQAVLKIPEKEEVPVYACPKPPGVERPIITKVNDTATPAEVMQGLLRQRNQYKAWGEQLEAILDTYR